MNRKRILTAILVLAFVIALGSVGLAQDNATVTITVLWTDGTGVDEAEVTIHEPGDEQGPGDPVSGTVTTGADGVAVFTDIPQGVEYEAIAKLDEGRDWDREAHTNFWVHEDDVSLTMYMFSDGETDVRFSVGGPLGVSLHVHEGYHHQHISMGDTEFLPSRLSVEVHNDDGDDNVTVTITAFTIDGDWDGNLVWNDPAEGEIALQFSAEETPTWETASWLGEDGEDLTLTDSEEYQKDFWIRGIVGAGTADKHGRIIFRAVINQ